MHDRSLPEKILIVDDSLENIRLLSSLLTREGYEIISAINGPVALLTIQKQPPDLILLDVMIPEMDGYEVCRYLKSQEQTRHIPIIFLSGLDSELDKVEAFKVGGSDYVTKPFYTEEIIFRVKAQLSIINEQNRLKQLLQEKIAERNIVERELNKSRTLLTGILDSSLDGMAAFEAIRDRQNKILDFRWLIANPLAAMTFGETIQSLQGKQLFVERTPGHLFDGLFNAFVQVVESCTVLEKEHYYNSLSFKAWFQIVAVKLGDGFAITFRDVTECKQLELTLTQTNSRLVHQVNIDSLTQIANRRCFDECIIREWSRCAREKEYLSLILCDVDYFKAYNDAYGHQAGDRCLHSVAKAIERAIERPADGVFRYGGEEFAIILPNTEARGAIQVAEEIRDSVKYLQIPHTASKIGNVVSLSLGVSSIIPDTRSLAYTLISNADNALYDAKLKGRNRVVHQNIKLQ